jgi:hypothetical protein
MSAVKTCRKYAEMILLVSCLVVVFVLAAGAPRNSIAFDVEGQGKNGNNSNARRNRPRTSPKRGELPPNNGNSNSNANRPPKP